MRNLILKIKTDRQVDAILDSCAIDDIVLECLMSGRKSPGDLLSYELLSKAEGRKIKRSKYLQGISTELYSLCEEGAVITTDKCVIDKSINQWIDYKIRMLIVPPGYNGSNPDDFFKRFIRSTSYSESQQQFMSTVKSLYLSVISSINDNNKYSKANIYYEVKELVTLFGYYDFMRRVRDIINGIIVGQLGYQSDISNYVLGNLSALGSNPNLFFEYQNGQVRLRCDLNHNPELLYETTLYSILWEINDAESSALIFSYIKSSLN